MMSVSLSFNKKIIQTNRRSNRELSCCCNNAGEKRSKRLLFASETVERLETLFPCPASYIPARPPASLYLSTRSEALSCGRFPMCEPKQLLAFACVLFSFVFSHTHNSFGFGLPLLIESYIALSFSECHLFFIKSAHFWHSSLVIILPSDCICLVTDHNDAQSSQHDSYHQKLIEGLAFAAMQLVAIQLQLLDQCTAVELIKRAQKNKK